MIERTVIVSPEAARDLGDLFTWVLNRAGETTALRYLSRVEDFIARLGVAAERGTPRDDVRPGLRIVGFERSLTLAFRVETHSVTLMRVFKRGRNWTRDSF